MTVNRNFTIPLRVSNKKSIDTATKTSDVNSIIAYSLYPLQQLWWLEADVQPVCRLTTQFNSLQLPESGRGFHLAIDRTTPGLPPEGQGHAKMSIAPHLAATQPYNHQLANLQVLHTCTGNPVSLAVPASSSTRRYVLSTREFGCQKRKCCNLRHGHRDAY